MKREFERAFLEEVKLDLVTHYALPGPPIRPRSEDVMGDGISKIMTKFNSKTNLMKQFTENVRELERYPLPEILR